MEGYFPFARFLCFLCCGGGKGKVILGGPRGGRQILPHSVFSLLSFDLLENLFCGDFLVWFGSLFFLFIWFPLYRKIVYVIDRGVDFRIWSFNCFGGFSLVVFPFFDAHWTLLWDAVFS